MAFRGSLRVLWLWPRPSCMTVFGSGHSEGGTDETERRAMRRTRQATDPAEPAA